MATIPAPRSIWTLRRGITAAVVSGAVALLTQLPLAAASFTASTGTAGSAFAAAASFCTAPGSITTTIASDTMAVQTSPTTTFGSATTLEVRSHTSDNKRMFIRPNLPSIPARCTLERAVMTLTVRRFTTPARTYAVYRSSAAWTAGGLTWNNQPAPTGSPATSAVTATTWDVDVTAQVAGLYEFGNFGLIFQDTVENSAADRNNQFGSLDGSNPGPATVTYTWG